MNKKGFTLVELIVYIGIVSIVVVPLTTITWMLIGDQVKQERITEVNDIGTFALQRISQETKEASSINVGTVFDTNPGTLTLEFSDKDNITFDTYEKAIVVGSQNVVIRTLRITEGSNPSVDLTSDLLSVSQFYITDRSTSSATSIQIELGVEAVNPTNTKAYEAQNSWATSITLR